MNFPLSTSEKARKATHLVSSLQSKFVDILSNVSDDQKDFEKVEWLRDDGRHGGGERMVAPSGGYFDRASINVSHVHYDDVPEKKLASASALSSIVHPNNPHLPSIHIHFSWTEMRDGSGYWRMMADLNPSIPNDDSTALFDENLKIHAGDHYKTGKEQGDKYFFIPALNKHRGVSHFYLEGFDSGDFEKDYALAENIASKVMETYSAILKKCGAAHPNYSEVDKQTQINYHTLYLYQVLTLDKGTTAGLLTHDQNDLGTLGSLPSTVNSELLKSWIDETPQPVNALVEGLSGALSSTGNVGVNDEEKTAFIKVMRDFYAVHQDLLTFKN